jgi:hypothetical protein
MRILQIALLSGVVLCSGCDTLLMENYNTSPDPAMHCRSRIHHLSSEAEMGTQMDEADEGSVTVESNHWASSYRAEQRIQHLR